MYLNGPGQSQVVILDATGGHWTYSGQMQLPEPAADVVTVRRELQRLRHGAGLASAGVVLQFSVAVQALLVGDGLASTASSAHVAMDLMRSLHRAISHLRRYHQLAVRVDLNLVDEHSYPTLTERQESLARLLGCSAKTIRRHSDQAFEALAYLITEPGLAPETQLATPPETTDPGPRDWRDTLRQFWKLSRYGRIDIVCSEIPESERARFASPRHRNYVRYAKFADLDALIYVRGRIMQTVPDIHIRDFTPSEYHGGDTTTLVVIGGSPWNPTYRDFLSQLPYHFAANLAGQDEPIVVPMLDNLTIGPRWAERGDLLADLAVITRLTLAQDSTVFLLGGCLTLGVLGAARCFLQCERGAANVDYVTKLAGDADFVLVTEARRVGGITHVADLAKVNPLLLLARRGNEQFAVIQNNTAAWIDQ